jgi:hypothetical protein
MSEMKFVGSKCKETEKLYGAELLNAIRADIKASFPKFKFKIHKRHHNSFSFHVMSGPIELTTQHGKDVQGNHMSVNPYWIHDLSHCKDEYTFSGRLFLKTLVKLIESFNYDDSDIQTDYFHTRFYLHVEIGDGEQKYEVK